MESWTQWDHLFADGREPHSVLISETVRPIAARSDYTLELPARCPYCREPIRTLR